MKKQTLLALNLLALSLPAFSGTAECGHDPQNPKQYHQFCTSPYMYNPDYPENGTDIGCVEPGQRNEIRPVTNLGDKKDTTPFLFYYAIDTKEPFMRTTVDFEIKKLRQACAYQTNNVHWVAFVNSLYTGEVTGKKYQFLYCGDRNDHGYEIDSEQSLDRFQVLTLKKSQIDTLKIKEFLVSNGILMTEDGEVEIDFHTRYGSEVNSAFSRVPLAHPDFFHDLFEISKNDLFVQEDKEFTPFVHIKSHGSKYAMMTGLTDNQEEKKNKCQDSVMNNEDESKNLIMGQWWNDVEKTGVGLGPIKFDKFLVSPFTKVATELEIDQDFYLDCEKSANAGKCVDVDSFGLPSKVLDAEGAHLDPDGGHLDADGGHLDPDGGHLDPDGGHLGDEGNGLGYESNGLGASDGLGIDDTTLGIENEAGLGVRNSFGTPYLKMIQLITKLTLVDENSSDIGFMMFESCESTVESKNTLFEFTKFNLPKLKAFYSAKGSLWYRNLNWHYSLVKANGNAGKLQEILLKSAAGIPNSCIANEDATGCKK